MLNPKLHQRFVCFAIATISQAVGFSCFLADSYADPDPLNPIGSPTQTVSGGTRGRNSQCLTDKDGKALAPLTGKEQKTLNSLDVQLQKIVAYSQKVGWVKASGVQQNVAEYAANQATVLDVLVDFERLNIDGFGDLRGVGDDTEFCAFVYDAIPPTSGGVAR